MRVHDELLVCPEVEEAAGGIIGAGADGFTIREELRRAHTRFYLGCALQISSPLHLPVNHQEATEVGKPSGTKHWIVKFESAERGDLILRSSKAIPS